MSDDPLDVDPTLVRRVPTSIAARYIGSSKRHVVDLIHDGEIEAIPISRAGARRVTWAVSLHSLRAYLERQIAQGKKIIGVDGVDGEHPAPRRR